MQSKATVGGGGGGRGEGLAWGLFSQCLGVTRGSDPLFPCSVLCSVFLTVEQYKTNEMVGSEMRQTNGLHY